MLCSAEAVLTGVALSPQTPDEPAARVLIAGDVCRAFADPRAGGALPDDPLFGFHGELEAHGLCICNLECPLTAGGAPIVKSGPSLRSDPADALMLRSRGFTLAGLANNHLRDYGSQGVLDTIDACRRAGLATVGAGRDAEDARLPLVTTVDGVQLGIVAVAENEFASAGPALAGASPFDPLVTPVAVAALRRQVDAVLVLFHCGTEGYALPSPGVARACRALVDAGAAAVICCHSHVPGGFEVYRDAPIAYGMGNFLFPLPPERPQPASWYEGYCVSLTLGRGRALSVRLVPYRQERGGAAVVPLGPPEARALAEKVCALSRTIADDRALAEEWVRLCRSRKSSYFGPVLGLSRLERKLLARGVWPSWRIRRSRLPGVLNLVRCESHREALMTLLAQEGVEGGGEDGV